MREAIAGVLATLQWAWMLNTIMFYLAELNGNEVGHRDFRWPRLLHRILAPLLLVAISAGYGTHPEWVTAPSGVVGILVTVIAFIAGVPFLRANPPDGEDNERKASSGN